MSEWPRATYKLAWSTRTGKAIRHGIPSGYSTHGCRCDECFAAFKDSNSHKRERAIVLAKADKRHT